MMGAFDFRQPPREPDIIPLQRHATAPRRGPRRCCCMPCTASAWRSRLGFVLAAVRRPARRRRRRRSVRPEAGRRDVPACGPAAVASLVRCWPDSPVGLGSGLASAARSRAATAAAAGSGATFVLHTVPRIRGVRVILDGRTFQTDPRPGSWRSHSLRPAPRPHPPAARSQRRHHCPLLAMAGWHRLGRPDHLRSRQAPTSSRRASSSPIPSPSGSPTRTAFRCRLRDVTRLTIDNSLGKRFTFSPAHPPQALAVNRVVRNQAGLVPLDDPLLGS